MNTYFYSDLRIEISATLVPWDSETLGFGVVQIDVLKVRQVNAQLPDCWWLWLKQSEVKFVSCRLQARSVSESFFLQHNGFLFIEQVLHPTLNLASINNDSASLIQVKEITGAEQDAAATMAMKSFGHERFHADPRIPNELANQRYANWVANLDANSNQTLLGAFHDGQLVGFFIVENLESGRVYWHLTAITPDFQGVGLGFKTWQAMLCRHQHEGAKEVSTTIAATNTKVLNLYGKLGFKFAEPSSTFHWMDAND